MLPKYRVLLEQLTQRGLLKVICGTDTLGVGINVPIRTVLFTRLCKFDGQKTGILSARDFHQISGRAGRKGFDDRGWVVAQAPEHVVENLKLDEKSARDGKKSVKRKPPEKNFVNWDKQHLPAPDRRAAGTARFPLPGLARHAAQRPQPPGRRLPRHAAPHPRLPRDARQKKAHLKRAWQLFRSLVERKIIEFIPKTADGAYLRVNVELQEDFSMDQALSLYLHDTIP